MLQSFICFKHDNMHILVYYRCRQNAEISISLLRAGTLHCAEKICKELNINTN